MEFWLCCWWSSLWMVVFLLRNVSTDLSSHPQYSLSNSKASFDQAMMNCRPGVLPSVATQQERQEILQLLSKSKPFQENITVWVGLRKSKHECSTDGQPLRGFKWVENGNQASAINWLEEPKLTCTGLLCGALRQQQVQSEVTWGLIPTSCKSPYHFICKGSDAHTELQLKTSPTTSKPDSTTFRPNVPTTSEPESCEHSKGPKHPSIRFLMADSSNGNKVLVECWSAIKLDLFCSGVPAVWRVLDGSPANFSIICQKCEEGFQKDSSGFCVDVAPATSDKKSLSHILIPVLAVVAVLLVILVIIGVVKCCLKRRKKMKTKP